MSKLREKQKLLGLPEHQLILDCITRWGSTYEMLKEIPRAATSYLHYAVGGWR